MSRFFIPPEQIHNDIFVLAGSEARHAAVVLRKKIGDTIEFFDGKDLSYRGRIDSISSERVEGVILERQAEGWPCACELILYQALIKGPKWDWLVEKGCEIGVVKLVPLMTARTIVKPSREAALERWKRIALAAAKQCGRPAVMEISEPKPFPEAIASLPKNGLALIPWEKEQARTIRAALSSSASSSPAVTGGGPIGVFIGPEGGWDTQEVDLAVRHGVVPVTLGPTLLRSETAGLVAATLVLAERGGYS
jgi:16S rRNA (uracil1498-N3)-methyltransferase